MSNFPPVNSPTNLHANNQDTPNLDHFVSKISLFSNQLHTLLAMLSEFRKHICNSLKNSQSCALHFPPHVNLEIARVLHIYKAKRLSEVMSLIQAEINKLAMDAKKLNNCDDFSKYDFLQVLESLEDGFNKIYHMQKIMEDVEEHELRQAEAAHE